MEFHHNKPSSPSRGDVWVFSKTDSAGRYNSAHSHTNYGYSGYLVVVVWNGSNWCRLTKGFLASIGVAETSYEYRYEVAGLISAIEHSVVQFAERGDYEIEYWPWKGRLYAKLTAHPKNDVKLLRAA